MGDCSGGSVDDHCDAYTVVAVHASVHQLMVHELMTREVEGEGRA